VCGGVSDQPQGAALLRESELQLAIFEHFGTWAETIVDRLGYVGVAMLVALESVFPPIPSELVLPLAGFASARGETSTVGMILAATIGSVVGAWVLYALAAGIGQQRLHVFVTRYGRWFGVDTGDLIRAELWFDRRSSVAISVGRCIPLVRSLVSIPAGFRRVPPMRFTVLTALGSAVWNAALIVAGAVLGDQWERVADVVGALQWGVILVIVAAGTSFVVLRVRRRFARRLEVSSDR
jgi:membrane protein DedA with SNARE-associated domain